VTDDAALHERMLDSMEAWFEEVAERARRRDGVLASVCPSIPDRSVFNSVVYRDGEAMVAAVEELAELYDGAGVNAWTVWVPRGDERVAAALRDAGHLLDASPEAMAAPLDELDLGEGAEGLDWERGGSVDEMCSVLEEAFHWPAEPAARLMAGLEHVYLARLDGEVVSSVAVLDVGTDCSVWNVGTREAARGRRLAGGLMRQALLDARERGCETTSLQATQLGRPVYRRIGYRELGALDMYERRRS